MSERIISSPVYVSRRMLAYFDGPSFTKVPAAMQLSPLTLDLYLSMNANLLKKTGVPGVVRQKRK
jgi:hypothetical protein